MKDIQSLFTFLVLTASFVSCINKSDSPEPSIEDDIEKEIIPCDFDISSIEPNSTIVLDCIWDLEEDTIKLPENVIIAYDGGDVLNGGLVFNGGIIDGRILNSALHVTGEVTLADPIFTLDKDRWNIEEGETSDEIAKQNKDVLQYLIDFTKSLGASTFQINALDAYFKVDVPLSENTPERAAITLPSEFTLKMTDDTHIRMQPNAYIRPTLLSVTNDNSYVTIEGGNLYGDRDSHDYSDGEVHAWGHTLRIKGADHVEVRNVSLISAMGDGINISGLYHYFQPEHIKSSDIIIDGCTFINCRRISLSITAGERITIDGNTFIDGGIDTEFSSGAAPRSNINIEPVRVWEDGEVGGTLKEYEKVFDVSIINNTQKGRGAFLISHADGPILVDNNSMESTISYTIVNGIKISNNDFQYNPDLVQGSAISATGSYEIGEHPLVFDNEISGNNISGYSTGINIAGQNVTVFENSIEANSGIVFSAGSTDGIVNAYIYANTINAEQYGIAATKWLKDVIIEQNNIEATTFPIYFNGVNNEGQGDLVQVKNNILKGDHLENTNYQSRLSNITNSHGIILSQNTLTGGFELVGCENLTVFDNKITSNATHGIVFFNIASMHSEVYDNAIQVTNGDLYECIKQRVELDETVKFQNNTCN